MILSYEHRDLIGITLMSAINTLSAMGFSCKDISKDVLRPSLKIAGMLHCSKPGAPATTKPISILLPFSSDGIILDVLQGNPSDPT
ncbi:MAG: hypothetical protein ACK6BG_02005 [Cyanobacteriota bacterium]